jgi:hypothetical protein
LTKLLSIKQSEEPESIRAENKRSGENGEKEEDEDRVERGAYSREFGNSPSSNKKEIGTERE